MVIKHEDFKRLSFLGSILPMPVISYSFFHCFHGVVSLQRESYDNIVLHLFFTAPPCGIFKNLLLCHLSTVASGEIVGS